jgi:hypothetical protein
MFNTGQSLKYSAIILALLFAATYYAKNFTHLLSPAPVCRADQFCGGTEPLIPPDLAPRLHWEDQLSRDSKAYVKDHEADPTGPQSEHQEQGRSHEQYLDSHTNFLGER